MRYRKPSLIIAVTGKITPKCIMGVIQECLNTAVGGRDGNSPLNEYRLLLFSCIQTIHHCDDCCCQGRNQPVGPPALSKHTHNPQKEQSVNYSYFNNCLLNSLQFLAVSKAFIHWAIGV